MESVCVIILLFVLGAMLGSFGCCQAWRIRKKDKSKWSHCMNCKYRLRWYDNIPIVSWVSLGGRCRKCRKPIGYSEILSEIGLALVFVASFYWWPARGDLITGDFSEVLKFVLFLLNLVLLLILFVHDAKWKELPVSILVASSVVAAMFLGVNIIMSYGRCGSFDWLSLGGAIIILPVFYYLMYRVSKERWVGGGDWMLCVPLALMLGNFWLALFALFFSNIIGSVISLPIAIRERRKGIVIPFGPFLILGFLTAFFLQAQILQLISV